MGIDDNNEVFNFKRVKDSKIIPFKLSELKGLSYSVACD